MKKMFYIIILFSVNIAFSQSTVNELIEKLNKHPQRDTIRCFILNQVIEEEQEKSIWIVYNSELKEIALENLKQKNNQKESSKTYQKYLSIAYNNEGAFAVYDDKYQTALKWYKQSYEIASKINYIDGCALSLQNIGTAYDYVGKLDLALLYLKKAYQFSIKSKNTAATAYILTDLGYVYNNLGQSNLAITYNLKALKIFEKLQDNIGIERTSFAIGRIFDSQKYYAKSLYYYNKSLLINTTIKDTQREALLLNSISSIYINQNLLDKAAKNLDKTIVLCKQNNFSSALASCYRFYGDIYFKKNILVKATMYYQLSADIYKKVESDNFYAKVLIQLATINLKSNKIELAKEQALNSYSIGLKSSYPSEQKNASEVLGTIYELEKDYKNALKYKTISSTIGDSIYFDEAKDIALKATNKYETEKKELQIKSLQKDKQIASLNVEKQRNFMFLLLFFFVSVLTTIYVLFNRFKIKKQNESLKAKLIATQETLIAEKKASQSELKAFKSQMNPHFFYNALNTVQSYILSNDKKLAISYLSKFSTLTRSILEMTEKEFISISDEIKTLELYLDIEKARFNEDFEFNIKAENIADLDQTKIPSMFLQPYVENAVKHGLLHKVGTKKLDIDFKIQEEILYITIDDNGIGREKSGELNAIKNKNHKSFATEAMEKRIDILNKTRIKPIQLRYFDKKTNTQIGAGTLVNIEIPL